MPHAGIIVALADTDAYLLSLRQALDGAQGLAKQPLQGIAAACACGIEALRQMGGKPRLPELAQCVGPPIQVDIDEAGIPLRLIVR